MSSLAIHPRPQKVQLKIKPVKAQNKPKITILPKGIPVPASKSLRIVKPPKDIAKSRAILRQAKTLANSKSALRGLLAEPNVPPKLKEKIKRTLQLDEGVVSLVPLIKRLLQLKKIDNVLQKQYDTKTLKLIVDATQSPVPKPNRVTIRPRSTLKLYWFTTNVNWFAILKYRELHPSHCLMFNVRNLKTKNTFWTPFHELKYKDASGAIGLIGYNDDVDLEIIQWTAAELRFPGSCDTTSSRVVKQGPFKVQTIKSKDDNCLVNCFIHHMRDRRQARSLVTLLNLTRGPKQNEDIEKLANFYRLYAAVWPLCDVATKPLVTKGNPEDPVINILHTNNHFSYIVDGAPAIAKDQEPVSKPKLQKLPDLTDETKDFAELADIIAKDKNHWIIDGPAGSGKTTLARMIIQKVTDITPDPVPVDSKDTEKKKKRIPIAVTASTGLAARHLNGITIDRYLLMNRERKIKDTTLLVDEVSMIDANKMEEVATFALKKHLKLILIGDPMQLPPVKRDISGWFFQSDQLNALSPKRLLLTKVRRTQNQAYAELCNRFRQGQPTPEDIEFMASRYIKNADPMQYDLYIASTNKIVNLHNARAYSAIPLQPGDTDRMFPVKFEFNYLGNNPGLPNPDPDQVPNLDKDRLEKKMRKIAEKHSVILKLNVRVIATKNDGKEFSNGQRGTVVGFGTNKKNEPVVRVLFDDTKPKISEVIYLKKDDKIQYSYLPLKLAYALTVHKAQGLTCNCKLLYDADNTFEAGMYYTAITRVTDPTLLTITGSAERPTAQYYNPNPLALKYIRGDPIPTMSEYYADQENPNLYFHQGIPIDPLNCLQWKSQNPSTVYYFKLLSITKNDTLTPFFGYFQFASRDSPGGIFHPISEQIYTDDIEKRVMEDLQKMAKNFEDIANTRLDQAKKSPKNDQGKFGKIMKDMRKWAWESCPRFCSYDGSIHDHYHIGEAIINSKMFPGEQYFINMNMKGFQMINFTVWSRKYYIPILKSHDINQLLNMSFQDAATTFAHVEVKDQTKEIEVLQRMTRVPDLNETITFEASIFPKDIMDEPKRFIKTQQQTFKPGDIVNQTIRNVQLLSKIYESVNFEFIRLSKLSVFTFLTTGQFTWYNCLQRSKVLRGFTFFDPSKKNTCQKTKEKYRMINLYPCNFEQDQVCRKAVYGGRACPRIFYTNQASNYVFIDISGMYGAVTQSAYLPCGQLTFVNKSQIINHIKTIQEYARNNTLQSMWQRNPDGSLKDIMLPVYFIANIDFKENERSLEPVLPEKTNRTIYTNRRRTQWMTSLDLAMILVKGGEFYGCDEMLHFSSKEKYCAPWTTECLDGKAKQKKEGNLALAAIYKNNYTALSGQTYRKDFKEEFKIVDKAEDARRFVETHEWTSYIIGKGDFDILFGNLKDIPKDHFSSRPTYAGVFILAFSRLMLQQAFEIINPTNDPLKQPLLGDTDSLAVPVQAAIDLRRQGFFPETDAKPGQFVDDLADTMLNKTDFIIPKAIRNTPEAKAIRDKYNGLFFLIKRGFEPIPKVYAIEFEDPVTKKLYYKFRAKGFSPNSQYNEDKSELLSAGLLFEAQPMYEAKLNGQEVGLAPSLCFTLPDGLKRVTPSQVPEKDRKRQEGSETLLTLRPNHIARTILKHVWTGRKHIGNGVTVPYDWKP